MTPTELTFARGVVGLFGLALMGVGLAIGRGVMREVASRRVVVEEDGVAAKRNGSPDRSERPVGLAVLSVMSLVSLALIAAGIAVLTQPGVF